MDDRSHRGALQQVLLQPSAHGRNRSPVNGARTEAFEQREVFARRVALVSIETVVRVGSVEREHFGITYGFRENGCCRDFCMQPVAANDRTNRELQIGGAIAINPHLVGRQIERLDRSAHGKHRRAQNVECIDFLDTRERYCPGLCVASYPRGERTSTTRTQQLRIS